MSESVWKEIKLEKYRELIHLAVGRDCAFALCDHCGSPVWTSDGPLDAGIGAVISELTRDGFDWNLDAHSLLRHDVDGNHALLYERIDPAAQECAWLAILVERSAIESTHARIRSSGDALKNLGACIGEEYQLNRELNGLAHELEQRQEELNLFYSLDESSGIEQDPQEGLRPLLKKVVVYAGVDLAAFVSSSHDMPDYATNDDQVISDLDLILIDMQGGLFRFVASTRKTLILNRADEPRRRYLFTHVPYKVLASPVIDGRAVSGMLVLLRHGDGPDFSNSDRSLANVMAHHLGVGRRNRAMLGKMQKFGEQMAGALIEAVEAKDPYTAGHSERVQAVAVHTGLSLGIGRSALEDLFWGSILHDVGKLGVPDVILSKPGELTADEYAFIKIHPEQSYEILRHIHYLSRSALDGARYHHERMDGKGYPAGLQGKEIPLPARIIAVADAYDAMTSSRAYRPAMSHEQAVAEIAQVAGTQLDPEIVTAFESACRGGMAWLDPIWFQRDRRRE